MHLRFSLAVLLALAFLIYVGNAAWPPLLDDADASHAIAAREILERGDWTVLHINGIRYLEKPPLHYWLVAASYTLLGVSAFATRLPLALAVAGLVLAVYAFSRRFFGERAGFYAGLVMCTSAGTFLFTRIMIPDAIYALEFTLAFYLFLRAWTGSLAPRVGYWGCAALIGLATLTRALVGVVFPLAILTLFILIGGGWRRWRDVPLISSAAIFLLVALPWHLLALLRTPRFFWFYFMNEQVLRALGARYPQDYAAVPLPLWWAAHLVWFFPWSFFIYYALRELRRGDIPSRTEREAGAVPLASGQARLLLAVWAGFIMFFFSLTSGSRMEYYSFGAWPAIAILIGLGLERAESTTERWLERLQAALALIGIALAVVLGGLLWVSRNVQTNGSIAGLLRSHENDFYRVSMATFFDLTPQAFAALRLPAAGAAIVFLVGFGAAWLLRRRGRALGANLLLAGSMAGFFFFANLAFGQFEPKMSSHPLAEAINKELRPDDQIVFYGEFDAGSAIGFYTGRKVWIYNGRYNGLEFGSYYPDAPKIFLTDNDFPALWRGRRRIFLYVPEDQKQALLVRLPLDSTYLLAESGGKAVFVNQPLTPEQPTLANLFRSGGRANLGVSKGSRDLATLQ